MNRPTTIHRETCSGDKIVVNQIQRRLRDIGGITLALDQGSIDRSLPFLRWHIVGNHDRTRMNAVDADFRIARGQLRGQAARDGGNGALGDEIGGVVAIRPGNGPVTEGDDTAAFLLLGHGQTHLLDAEEGAECVHFKTMKHIGRASFFQRFPGPDARSMDQRINSAKMPANIADHVDDFFFPGQIRLE